MSCFQFFLDFQSLSKFIKRRRQSILHLPPGPFINEFLQRKIKWPFGLDVQQVVFVLDHGLNQVVFQDVIRKVLVFLENFTPDLEGLFIILNRSRYPFFNDHWLVVLVEDNFAIFHLLFTNDLFIKTGVLTCFASVE